MENTVLKVVISLDPPCIIVWPLSIAAIVMMGEGGVELVVGQVFAQVGFFEHVLFYSRSSTLFIHHRSIHAVPMMSNGEYSIEIKVYDLPH